MSEIHVLDLRKILERTKEEFPNKTNEEILKVLNQVRVNHVKFKFVFDRRFYIKCPKCRENKLVLFRKEEIFRCRECWALKRNRKKKSKNNRSKIYSRYVRPLEKLHKIERKLFLSKDLSDEMRAKLEKKAAALRKAIPEYLHLIRNEFNKILDEKD